MSSTEIVEKKQEVRQSLLKKRKKLTDDELETASRVICDRICHLDMFKDAEFVHVYLPIKSKKEVNTLPLIEEMFREHKRIVVPITEFDRIALRHVILKDISDLRKNKWGVPEPVHQEKIDIDRLDLVITPMVGGDFERNRIGYGKGYYDSFLHQVDCPKIGLLFDFCLVPELPVEQHDVKLDMLVTENRIIH